jgi:hypothetical protein
VEDLRIMSMRVRGLRFGGGGCYGLRPAWTQGGFQVGAPKWRPFLLCRV